MPEMIIFLVCLCACFKQFLRTQAGSLFCDGLTGALQEKTNAYSVSSHQLMFKLNFFSLFYLGAGETYSVNCLCD